MENKNSAFEYQTMRWMIGVIACLFPFICLASFYISQGKFTIDDNLIIPTSLSVTYYFGSRDFFVGLLFIVAAFLLSYNGRKRKTDTWHKEMVAAKVASISAFFVALFPTSYTYSWVTAMGLTPHQIPCCCKEDECHIAGIQTITHIHQVSAILLISILFYFCIRFYIRSGDKISMLEKDPNNETEVRVIKRRNVTYLLCAIGMVVTALLGLLLLYKQIDTAIFYVELFCLLFFGWSWFTAGKAIRMYSLDQRTEDQVSLDLDKT